jgi:mRNA interferase RelE/StbE
MPYRIELTPAADRQVARLRGIAQLAVRGVILGLATDPRPRGARRLVGTRNLWRIRLRIDGHPWRVVYRLDDSRQLIVVTRVVRRDEGTYRRL